MSLMDNLLRAGWVAALALVRLLVLGVLGAMSAAELTGRHHAFTMLVFAFLLVSHVSTSLLGHSSSGSL